MKSMDEVTTKMMEYCCDHLCKFPQNGLQQESLEQICAKCPMGQYVCDILNTETELKEDNEKYRQMAITDSAKKLLLGGDW